VANRRKVLELRHDVPGLRDRCCTLERALPFGIVKLHTFGTLQVHEVAERLFAEWQQGH
jgi:hypothetical protein